MPSDLNNGEAGVSPAAKRVKLGDGSPVWNPVHGHESDSEASGSSSDDDEEEEEEEEEGTYEGETDADGVPNGYGRETWPSGKVFEGMFVQGERNGHGKFSFDDGSTLEGNFAEGTINGEGEYVFADGSRLAGTYKDGSLWGPAKEFDGDGHLTFEGFYEDNMRTGLACFYFNDGGMLRGAMGVNGELDGSGVYYLYPGGTGVLRGEWKNGDMVRARFGTCTSLDDMSTFTSDAQHEDVWYRADVSTPTTISSDPLLSDPWEQARVYVGPSLQTGAGEGLFARVDVGAGEVVSLYNGVRITHDVVDGRDWDLNGNTISLDDELVLDVPAPYTSTEAYTATLGHKANHSFDNNSVYDRIVHPRFGRIKCIRTLRAVKAGEEITVTYGYEHDTYPDWYRELLINSAETSQ